MRLTAFVVAIVAFVHSPAAASVYYLNSKWPAATTGGAYSLVHMCIEPNSSTEQVISGSHEPIPSLFSVVNKVRQALTTWENGTSVRFVGFEMCPGIGIPPDGAVRLFIHPEAPNNSGIGLGDNLTQFKPWGNFHGCIVYNAARARDEYQFHCVQEYAAHEFGHAIGFAHEYLLPFTPASCAAVLTDPGDSPVGSDKVYYSTPGLPLQPPPTPSPAPEFAYFNTDYDWDSVMTYDDHCAHVEPGNRFGSPRPDDVDLGGARAVYPPVPPGPFDIGVLADVRGCPPGVEPITIYMDDENDNNQDHTEGWIGKSFSQHDTRLEFCRIDGSMWHPTPGTPDDPGRGDFAVLKLGNSCPNSSGGAVISLDNEDADGNNEDYFSGDISPSTQEFTIGSTTLRLCIFHYQEGGDSMAQFPVLPFEYGVFAPANHPLAYQTGSLFTDDENDNNFDFSSVDIPNVIETGHDTTFHTGLVSVGAYIDTVGSLSVPKDIPTTPGSCSALVDNQSNRVAGGCTGPLLTSCGFSTDFSVFHDSLAVSLGQWQVAVQMVTPRLTTERLSYVNVVDQESPQVTCPASGAREECTGPSGARHDFNITATDNCWVSERHCSERTEGGTFAVGRHDVSCSASDAAANSGTCNFTFDIVDTIPPALAACPEVTVECLDGHGVASFDPPAARDVCDGAVATSCASPSGSSFPLGTSQVPCTASDAAGNFTTCNVQIHVVDRQAPFMACQDVFAECSGARQAPVWFSLPVANDNCDGPVAATCNGKPGDSFPLGFSGVQCSAHDSSSHESSCTVHISVIDRQAPELNCAGLDQISECDAGGAVAAYTAPAAIDVCEGAVASQCNLAQGSTIPLGVTPVDCTAGDTSGNLGSCRINLTVVDRLAPQLACADQQFECTGRAQDLAPITTPSVSDRCDGIPPVGCDPAPSLGATGVHTVVCSATDRAGNTGDCTIHATVIDTLPPSIVCPAPITAEPTGPTGAVVAFTATGSDVCDHAPAVSCPSSGALFAVGTTTIVCTATDAAGNHTDCTSSVHVNSPAEVANAAQSLVTSLVSSGAVSSNTGNSLQKNLDDIQSSIAAGHTRSACNDAQGMVHRLQGGGPVPADAAASLIQYLHDLMAVLGC
jgi:hypothetical protein